MALRPGRGSLLQEIIARLPSLHAIDPDGNAARLEQVGDAQRLLAIGAL